jgi:hypothetical protein
VILPQDVGTTLEATVLSNGCLKCEKRHKSHLRLVMLPISIGFIVDNHVRKTIGKFRSDASINAASVNERCEHGCMTEPILRLHDK